MSLAAYEMRRLDFRLHDFTRCSWTSDEARALWQPRIHRILSSWQAIEWRAVAAGLRPCALQVIASEALPGFTTQLAEHGLTAAQLDTIGASRYAFANVPGQAQPGQPFSYRVAIGTAEHVAALKADWDRGRQGEIGTQLGYPACCCEFYERVWVAEHFVDTTWPMASNTDARQRAAERAYTIDAPFQANMLLRWLGVRAVPHLPCSFDCAATIAQADMLMALGRELGYSDEIGWLNDMLSWPAEWSALHGIAEIKTPLLKIATSTDATAEKYIVQRHGTAYPEAGAQGLRFPYSAPIQLRISDSKSFKRGLAHGGELAPALLEDLHTASG